LADPANRQPPTVNRQPPTGEINRSAFYKALEENNKELVNAQLKELKLHRPESSGMLLWEPCS
jgi:hypothetical protein